MEVVSQEYTNVDVQAGVPVLFQKEELMCADGKW